MKKDIEIPFTSKEAVFSYWLISFREYYGSVNMDKLQTNFSPLAMNNCITQDFFEGGFTLLFEHHCIQ